MYLILFFYFFQMHSCSLMFCSANLKLLLVNLSCCATYLILLKPNRIQLWNQKIYLRHWKRLRNLIKVLLFSISFRNCFPQSFKYLEHKEKRKSTGKGHSDSNHQHKEGKHKSKLKEGEETAESHQKEPTPLEGSPRKHDTHHVEQHVHHHKKEDCFEEQVKIIHQENVCRLCSIRSFFFLFLILNSLVTTFSSMEELVLWLLTQAMKQLPTLSIGPFS